MGSDLLDLQKSHSGFPKSVEMLSESVEQVFYQWYGDIDSCSMQIV